MNNDKFENLDTLTNQVLSHNVDVLNEDFEKNRIKTPLELAQNELFSDIPQMVDLEKINESMNADYAKAKKQKALEDDLLRIKLEKEAAIEEELRVREEEKALKAKIELDAKTAAIAEQAKAQTKQQSIDFTNVTTALYNSEESESSRNYKKLLGKLIKKTEPTTEPFKVDVQAEGDIRELLNDHNEISNIERSLDETTLLEKENKHIDKNSDNISVRIYSSVTAKLDTNQYIYLNKIIFASLATIFAICILETAVMYFVINAINPIHKVYYYISALISIIPLGVGLFIYAMNPNLKVKKKINYTTMFLNAIIITVLLLAIVIVIVLLTSISLIDPTDYVPKLVLPCLYIINYPLGLVAFLCYEKSKLFNIKQ